MQLRNAICVCVYIIYIYISYMKYRYVIFLVMLDSMYAPVSSIVAIEHHHNGGFVRWKNHAKLVDCPGSHVWFYLRVHNLDQGVLGKWHFSHRFHWFISYKCIYFTTVIVYRGPGPHIYAGGLTTTLIFENHVFFVPNMGFPEGFSKSINSGDMVYILILGWV